MREMKYKIATKRNKADLYVCTDREKYLGYTSKKYSK